MNVYNDRKLHETALAKIGTIRQEYDSHPSKPDSISNGWHNVLVTDNNSFCREAKAYVSNNHVKDFVIDNYLPLTFKSTGTIKKGKNVLTISKSESETVIVDVYFLYDLDEPSVADPPMEPGCVCFWSFNKKYVGEQIIVNNSKYDGLTKTFPRAPDCFEEGARTIFLKPNTYEFTAQKNGNDREGEITIKAGQCLKYRLD